MIGELINFIGRNFLNICLVLLVGYGGLKLWKWYSNNKKNIKKQYLNRLFIKKKQPKINNPAKQNIIKEVGTKEYENKSIST